MKISKTFQLKIVIFTAVKNHCILHGRVFVMFIVNSLDSIMPIAAYITDVIHVYKIM